MSQPSNAERKDVTADYLAVKTKWLDMVNEYNAAKDEVDDIQEYLDSWAFSFKSKVGLGADNVEDVENLIAIPNGNLSQEDLVRKQKLMRDKLEVLNSEIAALQKSLVTLEASARKEQAIAAKETSKQISDKYISEYNADPNKVLAEMLNASESSRDDIYNAADKIIYTCAAFDKDKVKLVDILKLWHKVALAREQAYIDYRDYVKTGLKDDLQAQKLASINNHYATGSKQMFKVVMNFIPTGLKGIKFIYENKDYQAVDRYLALLLEAEINNDSDATVDIIADINQDVMIASRGLARSALMANTSFSKLAPAVQEQLIEQQAYVNQLYFDLSYLDESEQSAALVQLKQYAEKLSNNIRNAIINNYNAEENREKFDAILGEIRAKESTIRADLFKRNVQDTRDKANQFALGAGLGLGWLLGAPVVVAGAAVVAKAAYESQTAQIPDIEQEIAFSESILADDYNFLRAEDQYWNVHKDLTIDTVTITGGSLSEKLTDDLKAKLQNIQDDIKAKAEEIHNNISVPINQKKEEALKKVNIAKIATISAFKMFAGVQVLVALGLGIAAAIMVAVGVAAPPLWPLLIGLGLGIVGGVVIGIVKGVVAQDVPAQKIIDKIVDLIYLPARPLVALADFTLVRPIKSLINTFDTGREKQGYAVVIGSVALAITGAFVLPIVAPVMGIFAAGLVGTLAGAFVGLGIGALVRDAQVYREKTKQAKEQAAREAEMQQQAPTVEKELETNILQRGFAIPQASIIALDSMAPGLSNKLAKHFMSCGQQITTNIELAKQNNDQDTLLKISNELTKLESDWNIILLSAQKPDVFCEVVEKYLTDQYAVERNQYIINAKQRKEKVTEQPHAAVAERRRNLRFADKPDFNMDFGSDLKSERDRILELREMEESIRGIRTTLGPK